MKPNPQKIVQSLMEIGLRQHRIARELGASQPTVSHIYRDVWGNSQTTYAMMTKLVNLAAKYGIRPDGSKDIQRHPRKSWKPMPPPPSKNKVVLAREAA